MLDFGDIARGQTGIRQVRIRNNSSTYSMDSVTVTAEDLFLNAGDWFTLSLTGSPYSYTSSVVIGNMAPGGTQLVYMKYAVPAGETLSVQAARLKASHAGL